MILSLVQPLDNFSEILLIPGQKKKSNNDFVSLIIKSNRTEEFCC